MIFQSIAANTGIEHSIALCIRVILAAACGAAIGIERKKNFKDAGLRTHILVCCGAAMFMIISKYGFSDLVGADGAVLFGTRGADPARIAAQVVSGIGFLGAGVIFKNGVTIKGLTTAAGLWMTAGVGMAIGAGLVIIGVFAAAFITIMQLAMHRKTVGIDSYVTVKMQMVLEDGEDVGSILTELTDLTGASFSKTKIVKNNNNTKEYSWTLKVPSDLTQEKIAGFISKHKEIVSIDILT